jgi:hypothetical protein
MHVPAIAHNAKLNDLVIDLGRCLLQYAAECGVWASDPSAERTLVAAAAQQREDIATAVEFLNDRGWPVDPGTYPTEFTDLQYLSLKYLLPRIIDEQRAVVEDLDEAVHTCVDDGEAIALLREVLAHERRVLSELSALSQPAPVAA